MTPLAGYLLARAMDRHPPVIDAAYARTVADLCGDDHVAAWGSRPGRLTTATAAREAIALYAVHPSASARALVAAIAELRD